MGLIPISEIPHDVPLSRRFGIQQGAEVTCIDDFSRSSVNSTVQTCEGPKPHTLDVFAAMCVQVMSQLPCSEQRLGRTFDLVRAYRQSAVKPSSQKFAYIVTQKPGTSELLHLQNTSAAVWRCEICPCFRSNKPQPAVHSCQGVHGAFAVMS